MNEGLCELPFDHRFLDNPLPVAHPATKIVSLLRARVTASETGEAVVFDSVFTIVE
jgi:hypothetical protein